MQVIRQLWVEESGALVSAELVTVATIGVVSTVVGLSTLATSVNDELTDLARSFRSLDQSYSYPEQRSCRGAWFAGSCYRQAPVEESLSVLCATAPTVQEGLRPAEPVVPAPDETHPDEPQGEKSLKVRPVAPETPVDGEPEDEVPAARKIATPDA